RDRVSARHQMEVAIKNQNKIDIYIVIAKEERRSDALGQIQVLRQSGFQVDYPFGPTKVGRQFQAAEELGASFAILFGDEWPQLKIKNLATREEKLIDRSDLLGRMGELVRR